MALFVCWKFYCCMYACIQDGADIAQFLRSMYSCEHGVGPYAYAATSPNSPRRRILADYFNNYNFS